MNNRYPMACLFDLDGVICDTAKYHFLAWKKLADSLAIPFTEEDNERLKGVSRMDSLKLLLSLGDCSYSDEEMSLMAEQKNLWYKDYIKTISSEEILEGVTELLEELKRENIKIALGSVSKNAPDILKSLNLEKYFDAVIDGNKVERAKPAPDVFLAGASALSLPPASCLVFEDAASGVEAAHNADMKCIGIGNSAILSHADLVIPDLRGCTLSGLIVKKGWIPEK